jgi:hypothetical protein
VAPHHPRAKGRFMSEVSQLMYSAFDRELASQGRFTELENYPYISTYPSPGINVSHVHQGVVVN